jgi:hypothetical protein
VRTNDPQRPAQPPTLFLNTLPGDQFAATLWPAPTARPRLRLPSRPLNDPAELRIPIGPTGVLVGAALRDAPDARPPQQRDDLVMWSLTDPQQATRIVMDTSDHYVRQLLVRAVAVGESVAIYSEHPQRWESLTQPNIAVVDRRGVPDFVPTIVVNDRPTAPPSAGLSATVITLGRDAGGPHPTCASCRPPSPRCGSARGQPRLTWPSWRSGESRPGPDERAGAAPACLGGRRLSVPKLRVIVPVSMSSRRK